MLICRCFLFADIYRSDLFGKIKFGKFWKASDRQILDMNEKTVCLPSSLSLEERDK